jgi:TonB family protein
VTPRSADGTLELRRRPGGGAVFPLPEGVTVELPYEDGLTVRLEAGAAVPVVGKGLAYEGRRDAWIGVSLLAHVVLLGLFYFLPPASPALSVDALGQDLRMAAVSALGASRTIPEPPEPTFDAAEAAEDGGDGRAHAGPEGQMGDEAAPETRGHYAIRGDRPDARLPRVSGEAAENVATISAVAAALRDWGAPTSPFGGVARGSDPVSAIGALMGDVPGASHGYGGFGMTGAGRGGGSDGEGTIGVGSLGTLGHGGFGGPGRQGYGGARGDLRGPREHGPPRVRVTRAEVRGGLSPDVIRRVVRRHLNEVRFCYEQQLARVPDLAGRVTVQFLIAPSGAVQSSALRSSDLGSARVEQCVVQAVRRWTFPRPDGGVVGVSYPFVMTPGH